MISIYNTAKRELGYNATRFLQMISEQGGLSTARQLLWSEAPSEGFTTLWERGRLVRQSPVVSDLVGRKGSWETGAAAPRSSACENK